MSRKSSAEAAVLAADDARLRALAVNDIATLDRMFTDDFIVTHATGLMDNKTTYLASMSAAKFHSLERSDESIRLAGSAAWIRGITKATMTNKSGVERVLHNRFIGVYVEEGGQWKLAAWQSTPIV